MDKAFIFYCSPAGTTRQVAGVIEKNLAAGGRPVTVCELGRDRERRDKVLREIGGSKQRICLFIGSPVYSSHALPLVMELIGELPVRGQAYAVPFVTWGEATSGIALAEMGELLTERRYTVVGAARVVAVHSLMWEAEHPAGAGHPDKKDEELIGGLVAGVLGNLEKPSPQPLPPAALNYQPAEVAAEMKKQSLELARKFLPPRVVDRQRCTQCGVCADVCPVAALTLDPYPVYAAHCILCFNCMRCCPERAITADLSPAHAMIRQRREKYPESPLTRIFLPAAGL